MTTLNRYLDTVGGHRLLSAERERELGGAIQRGRLAATRVEDGSKHASDHAIVEAAELARDELVRHNLRLVVSIARRYPTSQTVDMGDLIQAGNHGLLRAADKFDPTRGFRFSTYATWWIRSSITRFIDQSASAMCMPVDTANALRVALASDQHLTGELELARQRSRLASLDAPLDTTDGGRMCDLSATLDIPVEESAEDRLMATALRTEMGLLPRSHRIAVALRYGLIDDDPASYTAVARLMGISRRTATQLVLDGVEMLKASERLSAAVAF